MHLGYHPVDEGRADARGFPPTTKRGCHAPWDHLESCSFYASVSLVNESWQRIRNKAFLRLIQLTTGLLPNRV